MSVQPYARNLAKNAYQRAKRVRNPGKSRTLRLIAVRSGGRCERCGGPGHSTHHLKNQGQGGKWSPENCVRLCGDGVTGCHGWATSNPDDAWEEGFHVRPWETPGDREIHSQLHGRVWLAADGSIWPDPIEGAASEVSG